MLRHMERNGVILSGSFKRFCAAANSSLAWWSNRILAAATITHYHSTTARQQVLQILTRILFVNTTISLQYKDHLRELKKDDTLVVRACCSLQCTSPVCPSLNALNVITDWGCYLAFPDAKIYSCNPLHTAICNTRGDSSSYSSSLRVAAMNALKPKIISERVVLHRNGSQPQRRCCPLPATCDIATIWLEAKLNTVHPVKYLSKHGTMHFITSLCGCMARKTIHTAIYHSC